MAGVLVAGAVVLNAIVQNRRDEQAVRTAVVHWLADMRDAGDVSYVLEAIRLPVEDEEPTIALASFGDVTLGDVTEHDARATVRTVMALGTDLPARYEPRDVQIRSTWRLRLSGDKNQRIWQVEQVVREGDFTTEPPMLPDPGESEIAAARKVAEQSVVAAFNYDAKQERSEYNQRQPDVYLTAPVDDAEAQRLADEGAEQSVPPFLIERTQIFSDEPELYGAAFGNAQELASQSMDYCGGEWSLRRIRASVDGWRPDVIDSGPLAALQRVQLTAALRLAAQATCRTTEFFSDEVTTERERGTVSVPVQVTLVRPHLQGYDEAWRVERLSYGDGGFNTIYAIEER